MQTTMWYKMIDDGYNHTNTLNETTATIIKLIAHLKVQNLMGNVFVILRSSIRYCFFIFVWRKKFALKWYEKSSKGQNKTHLVNFIGCHQGLWTSCSQFKELGKVEEDGVGHHRDDKVSGCVFMPAIKLISWSFFAKYIWIIGNRLNMALRVYLNVVVIL